jgi:hypothetical protein
MFIVLWCATPVKLIQLAITQSFVDGYISISKEGNNNKDLLFSDAQLLRFFLAILSKVNTSLDLMDD